MAEVTVVLPTWNRAHTLPESLASLLAQEGVEFEVVVVDDGSTDDTPRLLAGLAHADPRVRVVRTAHAGVAAARNAGIAAARAPFVAFHDSDDRALPGRLARPVAYLRAHPEVHLVIQNGWMLAAPETPGAVEKPWIRPAVAASLAGRPIGVAEVFRWNLGQLQGMTFTRRALEATGPLDSGFRILDDLDLVLRVVTRFPAVFLDVPAFAYRRNPEGLARNRSTVREEAIRLAEKLVQESPQVLEVLGHEAFRRRQARRWARLASERARMGESAAAREALARARQYEPRSVALRLRALWLRLRS